MTDFSVALSAGADGCHLAVEVTPGARSARFPDGLDPWRRRLKIRVRAPPQDGQANREVLDLVAERLQCGSGAVTLTAGAKSTHKTLHVRGMAPHDVLVALQAARQ